MRLPPWTIPPSPASPTAPTLPSAPERKRAPLSQDGIERGLPPAALFAATSPAPPAAISPAPPAATSPAAGWREDWGALRAFCSQIWTIVQKDLTLELRRWEFLGAMGLFTLLVLVIFTFALDLAAEHAAAVAPGALWVAYLFAGTLGLGRGFALEREWGTLEGLLLSPADRSAIYLAKMLGNALFMLAIQVVSLPVAVAFFNLPVLRLSLLPVLVLGTIGVAAVGTLFAAMAVHTRARDIVLPVLLFPITVPVVIASVKATAGVLDGSGTGPWLGLLAAFDALFIVVGMLTADAVLEE